MSARFLVYQVGCIECGVSSYPIDESGNLALPYRSLSPAADAIYEAYCTEADRLNREVSDREMLAAALKAAADHLTPYSVDQMPGAAFARHRLQVIARELENYHACSND